jgi:hypothetical protein
MKEKKNIRNLVYGETFSSSAGCTHQGGLVHSAESEQPSEFWQGNISRSFYLLRTQISSFLLSSEE